MLLSLLTIIALTSCNRGGTSTSSSPVPTTPASTPASSSSPSTPKAVEYSITASESEDYSITGLAEKAKEGDTVSFTVAVTDEAKHSIKTVKYNETTLTAGQDGSYSFTMPGENVAISVELELKSYKITNVVYSSSYDYYTPSVDLDLTQEYKVGDTVNFTLNFERDFSASTIKQMGIFVNDYGFQVTYDSTESTKSLTGLSFVMPASDVELAFMPVSPDTTSGTGTKKIVIDEKPAGIRVYSSESFLFDTSKSSYLRNNITVKREAGWVISKVTYKRENDEEWQTLDISSLSWTNNIAQLRVTSIKLDGDIHFKIEGHLAQTYSLTIVNGDKVTFKTAPATSYVEGDDVSLEFSAADSTQVISYQIEGATNTASSSYQSTQIKFKMPANNVTITFASQARGNIVLPTSQEGISAIVAKDGSYYSYSDTVTAMDPGKTFYVFVTPAVGYTATGAHLNGGDAVTGTKSSGRVYFKFTMPASGDANITVDVVKNGTISVVENDKIDGDVLFATDYYVSSSSSSYVKANNAFASGDTVYVLAKAKAGYSLGSATLAVEGLDNQTLTASTNSSGYFYWKFTMPANQKNASLTISTIENGTVSVTGDEAYFDSNSFTIKSSLSGNTVAANAISPNKTFYVVAKFKDGVSGYSLGVATVAGDDKAYTPTESSNYGTYYTFTMPASGNINITVGVITNGTIDISAHADVSEYKIGTSTSYPTTSAGNKDFAPGKTFYVFAKPVSGKKVTKAKLDDGAAATPTEVAATYGTDYSYFKFTMPTNGVANISFETANSHTATLDTTVTGLTLAKSSGLDSNGAAAVGDTVVVKATASYGYSISTIVAKADGHDDIALTKNSSGNYEFTMPDYDVTITGTVETAASVNITVKGTTLPSDVNSASVYDASNSKAPEFSYSTHGKTDKEFTWLVGETLRCSYRDSSWSTSANLAIVVTKTDGTTASYDMTPNDYGVYVVNITVEANWKSIEWKVVTK